MKKVFVLLVCIALIFVSACAKAPEKKAEVTKEGVATETVEPEEETVPVEEETAVPAPTLAPTPKPAPPAEPEEETVYIYVGGAKYSVFYHTADCPHVTANPGLYQAVSLSQLEREGGWLADPTCHGCPPNTADPEVYIVRLGEYSAYYHTISPVCPKISVAYSRGQIRLNQARWLGKTPCPTCSPPPPE